MFLCALLSSCLDPLSKNHSFGVCVKGGAAVHFTLDADPESDRMRSGQGRTSNGYFHGFSERSTAGAERREVGRGALAHGAGRTAKTRACRKP